MLASIFINIYANMFVNIVFNIIANINMNMLANTTYIMFAFIFIDIYVNMFYSMFANKTYNMVVNMFERPMKKRRQKPIYEFGVRMPACDDWAMASRPDSSILIIRPEDEQNRTYAATRITKKINKKHDE